MVLKSHNSTDEHFELAPQSIRGLRFYLHEL
jgi:hypothetical protein